MKIFKCFAGLISKIKNKRNPKPSLPPITQRLLQIRLVEPIKPLDIDEPKNITSYDKDNDSTKQESVKSFTSKKLVKDVTNCSEEEEEEEEEEDGHVSDPGVARATSWVASPKLKRSCSTITKFMVRFHDKTESFEVESVRSYRSADRVMLKKHSSMQILPSGSRKLWWKLFLWSHRNLHKHHGQVKFQPLGKNHQSGYTSDHDRSNPSDGFDKQSSDLCPRHNQWVAFSADSSSSMKRVDEWVKGLDVEAQDSFHSLTNSPKAEKSPFESEAIVHANSLIQSLSKSSSVAHISNIGLKAVPSISHFTSLKSIDLSNNFIVQITPASLPKGLHALNLSKNKISVIEGLRDLTRLRVLDLSYNRVSRIGQGLSNCTLIKELYLAGNKISNVEGLHRLLKLIVLDLSFNKIATNKAIGQLVANYNSLVALNILGNPIQSNVGEDQLRKTVSSLLPKLVYLNKQLIKPQRAREVIKDSVAKAAFGGGESLHHRRKRTVTKRATGSASPSVQHRGKRHGSKGRSPHQYKQREESIKHVNRYCEALKTKVQESN